MTFHGYVLNRASDSRYMYVVHIYMFEGKYRYARGLELPGYRYAKWYRSYLTTGITGGSSYLATGVPKGVSYLATGMGQRVLDTWLQVGYSIVATWPQVG